MSFVLFLILVWLVLYVTLYAAFGPRLGRWLRGARPRFPSKLATSPTRTGQWVSVVLALTALGGAWSVLGLMNEPSWALAGLWPTTGSIATEPPSLTFFALGQVASFVMGVLSSLLGNILHTRWLS